MAGSVRGARHVRRGEGNEDAVLAVTTEHSATVAVADGHGSIHCPRADRGSAFAVESAIATLRVSPPLALEDVAPSIVAGWRAAVDEDLELDPPTEPPRRELYGTTLLAAHAAGQVVRLVQVGDGDVAVASGNVVERPVIAADTGSALVTESLCQDDAAERVQVVDVDVDATSLVLLASDGFGGAFVESAWH